MTNDMFVGDFAENIVREFGLEHEPLEVRAAFLNTLNDKIASRVGARVRDALSEEKRGYFDEIISREDAGEIERFVSANVPDFDQVLKEEALKVVDIAKFGGNQ